jgi:hypothetical protein
MSEWGTHEGRVRKPCPEDPAILAGLPIGQFHCPGCGEMQVAGLPHAPPDADYEEMTGCDWPPGYE